MTYIPTEGEIIALFMKDPDRARDLVLVHDALKTGGQNAAIARMQAHEAEFGPWASGVAKPAPVAVPEPATAIATADPDQPKPKVPLPCPPVDDLTMMQIALWDNWLTTKKPKVPPEGQKTVATTRYKLEVDARTAPTANYTLFKDIPMGWRSSTMLFGHQEFGKLLTTTIPERVSQAYLDELTAAHAASTATVHFGLFTGHAAIVKRGGGYIPHHFVRIEVFGGSPQFCALHLNGEEFNVAPAEWTSTTQKGEPFSNRYVIRQARFDLDGGISSRWPKWATRR